jgi:cell division septation protein DedD
LGAALIGLIVAAAPDGASAAGTKYDRLEQLFLEGRYADVVSEADGLIRSGYGRGEDIYYLKGLSELKLKRFTEARESFVYITGRAGHTRLAFDAYLGIGDSYMLAGRYNDAIGAYTRVADEFPSDRNLPAVYSRMADCNAALGLTDKAARYRGMARQMAPLSFEARGAPAVTPAARQATDYPPAARPAARASASSTSPARPAARASFTNVTPKKRAAEPAEITDVVMAQDRPGHFSEMPGHPSPPAQDRPGHFSEMPRPFSVQVGSFKSRANAERLAKKLAASGYDARVEIPVGRSEKLYRVKVGPVSAAAEADAIAARLRQAGYSTKICN